MLYGVREGELDSGTKSDPMRSKSDEHDVAEVQRI